MNAYRIVSTAAVAFILCIGAGVATAQDDGGAPVVQGIEPGFPAPEGMDDGLMPGEELLTDGWWMMDNAAETGDEFGFEEGPLVAEGQDVSEAPMAGGGRGMGFGRMAGPGSMIGFGRMQGRGGMGGQAMMAQGGMMGRGMQERGGMMGRGQMMGRGGMHGEGPGVGRIALYIRNAEALKLTDDQVKKLKDIRSSFLKEAIDLRAKVATGRIELGELLDRENPDMGAVEKKIRANHDLDATLAIAVLRTGKAADGVLSADQLKAAKELGPKAFKDRPMRQGMFGGPARGMMMRDHAADNSGGDVKKDAKNKKTK